MTLLFDFGLNINDLAQHEYDQCLCDDEMLESDLITKVIFGIAQVLMHGIILNMVRILLLS